MKKVSIIAIIIIVVLLTIIIIPKESIHIKSISNEEQLYNIATRGRYSYNRNEPNPFLVGLIAEPLIPTLGLFGYINSASSTASSAVQLDSVGLDSSNNSNSQKEIRDYSKTNIQVENVDEADITKTDGNYIYSLSNADVIVTDVTNLNDIKIASRITAGEKEIPVDLLLYKNKLVVIYQAEYEAGDDFRSYSYYSTKRYGTLVRVFNMSNHETPKKEKEIFIKNGYYTTRCIDNNLYVLTTGYLLYSTNNDKKVYRGYEENGLEKEIDLKDIHYIEGEESNYSSIIAHLDLENHTKDVKLTDYLFDIENAYVSDKSIYILDSGYTHSDDLGGLLRSIFSLKGIFGLGDFTSSSSSYYDTRILKFDLTKNGELKYNSNTNFEGRTINQYSLDELNGHLRIAVNIGWNKGAKVYIYDEKLNKIGETETFGKNEQLYSSRFVGDRAYVVTYRNTDPFFVIDLSNEKNPKLLGALKIPGYSTYLHPYDENHLIGFGMETQENISRDNNGRVTGSWTSTVGMKMCLFDVTDVNNPQEVSKIVIGNGSTTSAILTNPKALLFSKDKGLIAIPVNRYNKEYENSNYNSNYYDDYVCEGYIVYSINLEDGIKTKGTIEHPDIKKKVKSITPINGDAVIDYYPYSYSYNYNNARALIRGLYINDKLFTVSQKAIYENDLESLRFIQGISLDK